MRTRQAIKNFKRQLYENHCAMLRFYGKEKEIVSYRKWLKLVNKGKYIEPTP